MSLKELAKVLVSFNDNPLGYVEFVFPWGKTNSPLEYFEGPRTWQKDYLLELGKEVKKRGFNGKDPVEPIQMSRASGHGIGKDLYTGLNVPTPSGMKLWGELKVGDDVFGPDGLPTKNILLVSP